MEYELLKMQRRACQEAVIALGFRKRFGLYWYSINHEVEGWLGMGANSHKREGYVAVWPNVGVRHHEVERLTAELMDKMAGKTHPTIGIGLGYLMPEHSWREWYFYDGVDPAQEAASIAAAITEYAIPYYQAHSHLSDIAPAIKMYKPVERVVALWLLGDPKLAEDEMIRRLEQLEKEKNLTSESYRRFAKRFSATLLGRPLRMRKTTTARAAGRKSQAPVFADVFEFQRLVLNQCRDALLEVGFRRGQKGSLTFEIGDECTGVVFLGTSVRLGAGEVEVRPDVGVVHKGVERVLADLGANPYGSTTLRVSLRDLGAEERCVFSMESDAASGARNLAEAVQKVGIPFLNGHGTLQQVYDAMNSSDAANDPAYRMPVAAHLLGRQKDAHDYVVSSRAKVGTREDRAAREFKTFAARFETLLGGRGSG